MKVEPVKTAKKAKVTHLASAHSPLDTRVFYKECKSLARAGYCVTLIAPHDHNEVRDNDVDIRGFPRSSTRLGRATRSLWHVGREAFRSEAEIYHFHDLELIPLGLLLRVSGKKVIYDVHEDYPRRGVFLKRYVPGWNGRPLAWPLERIENLAARMFSAVVTVTPALTARFARLNGRTVMVGNFPIVDEFQKTFEIPWSQRIPCVAYVGQISLIRGIKEIVEAIGLVSQEPTVTLRLAGAISPEKDRDLITEYLKRRRVEYVGVIGRLGVASLLAQVRAGLAIFHPNPHHELALPTKIFEYMAAGIPVIASDFPLWKDLVLNTGCGLTVDPLRPKAIAEAIEFVLARPQEAHTMGCNGRSAIEKLYNWENEEQKLFGLYRELDGRQSPAPDLPHAGGL